MANLPETETVTTQRCGELAGLPLSIVVTDETTFIRIGDQPAISFKQWFDANSAICAGALKLGRLRR